MLANSNVVEYNKIDAEVRRECQTEKELILNAQCEKIEQLNATHKSIQVHTQIRQATCRNQGACVTTCIEDKDGNIIMEQDKILARWHEYISEFNKQISVLDDFYYIYMYSIITTIFFLFSLA